jgi:beta-barrel assembly-enhancing protease
LKTRGENWNWFAPSLALLLTVVLFSSPAFGSSASTRKRSKSDRDIDAIGHRTIPYGTAPLDIANWYSLGKEKEIGGKLSSSLERSTALLRDARTAVYLERLAQMIAQNSDAQMPITVRVIDSEEVYALTLPGGYQYITRGLLLRIGSEGELASVLARGIAHTALRSAMRDYTHEAMLRAASIPVIFVGQGVPVNNTSDSGLGVPLTLLKFKRAEELDADYFGVQYVYKAGYDTECFIRFILTVWPASSASGNPPVKAFSTFPTLSERLEALRKETTDILPKRDGAVTATPEFADFQGYLRSLPSSAPAKSEPTLRRVNPPSPE